MQNYSCASLNLISSASHEKKFLMFAEFHFESLGDRLAGYPLGIVCCHEPSAALRNLTVIIQNIFYLCTH